MSSKSGKEMSDVLSMAGVSWLELLLGGLALLALSARAALSAFFSAFGLNQELHDSFQSYRHHIHNFAVDPLVAGATNLLLWVFFGLALFALLWALVVVIIDLRRDLVISQAFLHPHSFHRSEYWAAAVARRVIAATLYSAIAIYIYLLVRGTPIVYNAILSIFSYRTGLLPLTIPLALIAIATWLAGWHLTIVIRRLGIRLDKEIAKTS